MENETPAVEVTVEEKVHDIVEDHRVVTEPDVVKTTVEVDAGKSDGGTTVNVD